MNRPTQVTMDGHRCRIVWRKTDIGKFKDGYRMAGDHELGLIRVSPGYTRHKERVILVHELLHEVIELSKMSIPQRMEEYILNNIDEWLVLLLRENPALVQYLTEEDA